MLRSGHVKDVRARPVYTKEVFSVQEGLTPSLEHFPIYNAEQRGELMAFYAVAFFARNGGTFEVMTKADVETIRSRAASRNSDAWKNHFVEMGKKTVIRRLAKRMPQTPALQSALSTEDRLDAGDLIDAIQREERHIARPTYRAKQLPIAVKADAPYEVDEAAPAQNPRDAIHVTPSARTEAQMHAAQTAASIRDPYDEQATDAGEANANIRPDPSESGETRREAPMTPASSPRVASYIMKFGGEFVGKPISDVPTGELLKLLSWAEKRKDQGEFIDAAKIELDDRRFDEEAST